MASTQLILQRMLTGAGLLATYGLWVVCARFPDGITTWRWLGASLWAVGLFAGLGAILLPLVTTAALATSSFARPRPRRRAAIGAVTETMLLAPLFVWLLLNEIVYATTSAVLGPEVIAMVWNNPTEVFEAAWEMGAGYLLLTGIMTLAAAVLIRHWSHRSFRRLRASNGTSRLDTSGARHERNRVRRVAGAMSGGLLVLGALLVWQVRTEPSEALIMVFRSAPPFRAFNLTRALIGVDLTGPVPDHFGEPIISDETYQANMGTPRPPPPNVVLIIMESVPAKGLHCYGHPRIDVTPNIDALAEQGILFDHCQSAASFSSYGVLSILTSLYMLRDERYDYFKDTSFPHLSLPRALKRAGYELDLFSSGNESFDNFNHFYPPEDFDTYVSHDTTPEIPKPDSMRMDDRYALETFEAWMAKRNDARPFYCHFYLQSTHFNYEVPEPWYSHYEPIPSLYSNGDGIIHIPPDVLPKLKNQYDNAMRYADHWVGRIRAALDLKGELDNTIIVITGDHGEGFMEHGLARHGVHVWEEMIHVPLIIYVGRDLRRTLPASLPSRVPDTVSTIDIAPTVAGLVGIEPHPSWQGMDVLTPGYTSRDRPVFSILQLTRWQEVVTMNRIKYIYDLTDIEAMLFNLEADPGETTDLAAAQPDLAAAMKKLLAAWHTRQLHYYASRPFTHYIGRYDPHDGLIGFPHPIGVVHDERR